MSITMDMLQVLTLPNAVAAPPEGLKATALSGPGAGPVPNSPVLAIGGFTLWPLSYDDNRMSFGMVMRDPKGRVVSTTEMKGARYIYKITLDGTGDSGAVTFWGQADHTVQVPVGGLVSLMEMKDGS